MQSILKTSIWLTLAELVFNLSGYVVHSVLGRFLGPAEYGRYSLVVAFSTMIIVLLSRGVPIAMSKYLSEIRKGDPGAILSVRKTSAKVQGILIGTTTLLYFILAPVFAKLLGDPSLTGLFQLSSLILPAFALANFYIYYFNGIQKFNSQSFIKFYRGIAKIVLILFLTLFFQVPGAILGHALAPFSVFLVAFALDPFKKQKPSKTVHLDWKKLVGFAWPITVFMIFYEIMVSIDLFLVKALLQNDSTTGLYNSALTVGRVPFYAFFFLTILLLPKISESTANGDFAKTKKMLGVSMRFLFLLLTPSLALLSLFSDSAIRFFYGSKYSTASQPLAILCFGLGFLTVFYILAFVLNGAGKNKIPMALSILGAILNSVMGYFFIKSWGLVGASWAVTTTSALLTIFIVWYSNAKIAPFFSWKSTGIYIFCSALIYFLGNQFFTQGRFIFIFWSLILLVVYFALLYLLGEIKKEDLQVFRESLRKK